MKKLSKFVTRLFSPLEVLILASLLIAMSAPALAVNSFPLKPDGANAAPCTVVGSPYSEIECNRVDLTKSAAATAGNAFSNVYGSSVIPFTSTYMTLISTGGTNVMTSTPNISTTTTVGGSTELKSGTFLVLSSTATAGITLQDAGTLTGSQLQLGAATRTISQYKTLTLIYDATDHFWREMAYSNN